MTCSRCGSEIHDGQWAVENRPAWLVTGEIVHEGCVHGSDVVQAVKVGDLWEEIPDGRTLSGTPVFGSLEGDSIPIPGVKPQ